MAIIRKSEMEKLNDTQRLAKIVELERAILEMYGEGRKDKIKPLKKAIAALKTPRAKPFVGGKAPGAMAAQAAPAMHQGKPAPTPVHPTHTTGAAHQAPGHNAPSSSAHHAQAPGHPVAGHQTTTHQGSHQPQIQPSHIHKPTAKKV